MKKLLFKDAKIGIWGFGEVGKTALSFFNESFSYKTKKLFSQLSVWDKRDLKSEERDLIKSKNAKVVESNQEALLEFLEHNDYVVVSPGIDIRGFERFEKKFLCELDIFAKFFRKPTVAITGTLGKTTITKLFSQILSSLSWHKKDNQKKPRRLRVGVAGNVGRGMLSLLIGQEELDCAVLELSSFQLSLNRLFAPDIAIWSNFYPNHLDRHGSLESYLQDKAKILTLQSSKQIALLPVELALNSEYKFFKPILSNLKSQLCFVSNRPLSKSELSSLAPISSFIFYLDGGYLSITYPFDAFGKTGRPIFCIDSLPAITFVDNWLFILSALYILGIDLEEQLSLEFIEQLNMESEPHRIEHFYSFNDVEFYNDSKATIMEATGAAINKLDKKGRPIVLILGGLGKGIDRNQMVEALKKVENLKKIFCFGKECQLLGDLTSFGSLEEVVKATFEVVGPGDIVLFSPGGSSFDLFENYMQRGEAFKRLVMSYGVGKEPNQE